MSQLEQALEREKSAQSLLSDQSSQLQELKRRLESEIADRDHSEQSAKFALKVTLYVVLSTIYFIICV